MHKVLIVQNVCHEGPGLLVELLHDLQIEHEVRDLSRELNLPSPKNYSAVIVLGGADSANDLSAKVQLQLAWIEQLLKLKIPYLGICLGMQLLIKAAGGRVLPMDHKEIGLMDEAGKPYQVSLTREGSKDPLFEGFGGNPFSVFQLHGDTVKLGPNMQLIGTASGCPQQMVKVGRNAYGIQCHFELTPGMLESWMEKDADLQKLDTAKLRSDFEALQPDYQTVGRQLLQNFLKIADILS